MSVDKPSSDKPAASTSKKRTATGAKAKSSKGSEDSSAATASTPSDQATTGTPGPSEKEPRNAGLGGKQAESDVDAADKDGGNDKDNGSDGEEWESESESEEEREQNEKEKSPLLSEIQSTSSKSDSSQSREKTQEPEDDSSPEDDNPDSKDKSPDIGTAFKQAFKPRNIEINEEMTLTLTYKEGDPNSLPDDGDVVRAIRAWHISKAIAKNPPFASDIGINRPIYDRQTCFDREGNELDRSIFHASVVCLAKAQTGKIETKYALIVLHSTGKTGKPTFFPSSIRMPPGTLSWGFEWNSKDEQFQEDPFAVRIYRAEGAPIETVKFDVYLFTLLKANIDPVQKQLKERAKGWMIKQRKRKRPATSSKEKSKDIKSEDKPTTGASDSKERSRSLSPPPKPRKAKRTYTLAVEEDTGPEDSTPERLLNSTRIKLVSGSHARSRVFDLDGGDIKSLFKRAREFYEVKSSKKSFSLLCEISGIGSKALALENMESERFIGEDYTDEFVLLCHDVNKLSISQRARVEVVAKPGRWEGDRSSEDSS